MPQPDLTLATIRDISITAQSNSTDANGNTVGINRATLANGYQAIVPGLGTVQLQNESLNGTGNTAAISGVWSLDGSAFTTANNGQVSIQQKTTVADVAGNTAASPTTIETFTIDIGGSGGTSSGGSAGSFDYNFRTLNALPADWIATGTTASFSNGGMLISEDGVVPQGWGVRVIESEEFSYDDGDIVEIEFNVPNGSLLVGLGRKKADGGWGDFTDFDTIGWTGPNGNLHNGDSESVPNGSEEWTPGIDYRMRIERSGSNSIITYQKEISGNFTNIKPPVNTNTPAAITAGNTRVLLDIAFVVQMTVRRVTLIKA